MAAGAVRFRGCGHHPCIGTKRQDVLLAAVYLLAAVGLAVAAGFDSGSAFRTGAAAAAGFCFLLCLYTVARAARRWR